MRRRQTGRVGLLPAVLAVVLVGLTACSGSSGGSVGADDAPPAATGESGPAAASSGLPSSSSPPASSGSTVRATGSVTPAAALLAGLTRADVQAGLLSRTFSSAGSGRLVTVPGRIAAPSSRGRLIRVKVQVEQGLRIDGRRFAAFALNTLNDPRSWAHDGALRFSRTDGSDYDVRLVLASPDTSARMCRPLITYGKLSCHAGDAIVLTVYRWVKAIPDYGSDRTSYRRYVVNHEVGHALGHDHQYCPGKGRLAPVMQQQTKSLQGCRPNAWPYP